MLPAEAARPDSVTDPTTPGPPADKPPDGLDELLLAVAPVAERFVAAGYRLYLVGGVVRDLALARELGHPLAGHDVDLTTDARPGNIRRLVSPLADHIWAQGERFGTIGARVNGQDLEITTHRAEAYDEDSRKPVVVFGDDIAEDLARRDFTINAAAIEVPDGRLHDPHRGLDDLVQRVLRTPLAPEISFTDDPLRMLRAARFIPRFGLTPAPEVVAAARDLASRLDIVSVERVTDELERLLAVDDPGPGFGFLVEVGLFDRVALGFAGPVADPEPGTGGGPVAQATKLASAPVDSPLRSGSNVGPADRQVIRRAGMLWPLAGLGRSGSADLAPVAAHLDRLRYSKADARRTLAVLAGAQIAVTGRPDEVTVRRMAVEAGPDDLSSALALAVNLGAVGVVDQAQVRALGQAAAAVVAGEDLSDLDGPLSGAQIMKVLGIEPGPDVGRAVDRLHQIRIAEGPLSAEQARRRLREWWETEDPAAG